MGFFVIFLVNKSDWLISGLACCRERFWYQIINLKNIYPFRKNKNLKHGLSQIISSVWEYYSCWSSNSIFTKNLLLIAELGMLIINSLGRHIALRCLLSGEVQITMTDILCIDPRKPWWRWWWDWSLSFSTLNILNTTQDYLCKIAMRYEGWN